MTIRLLGATPPSRPSTLPGTIIGAMITALALAAVLRKLLRVNFEGVVVSGQGVAPDELRIDFFIFVGNRIVC
jgi:hypothetical protein